MSLLLALVVSAAPLRLVQSVQGAPVGVIELERDGAVLRYRATHVFREDTRAFETSWPVDDAGRDEQGREAELTVLSRRRSGCVAVREERSGRGERLCVEPTGRGTIDETPIQVRWDSSGALASVDVLDARGRVLSRFERSALVLSAGVDPFGAGFSIEGEGQVVRLEPPGGERLVPVGGVASRVEGSCLSAARAWVGEHREDVVQLGLVVEDGRAWPHAWVRTKKGAFLDPTLERGAEALSRRRYLALPEREAGTRYLELASGSRRVVAR